MVLLVTPILVRQGELVDQPPPFYVSFRGRGVLDQVEFHALTESFEGDPWERLGTALNALRRSLTDVDRAALTTTLGRAMQACHQELTLINQPLPMAARVGAGATCLALRDDEVYMARAGPGLIYLRDQHGVRALLGPPEGGSALGTAEGEIPVAMDRHPLGQGEALLASGSALEEAVGYEGLLAILTASPLEAARMLRLLMGEEPSFAAVLVTSAGG